MPASSGLKLSFMVSREPHDHMTRDLVELSQCWAMTLDCEELSLEPPGLNQTVILRHRQQWCVVGSSQLSQGLGGQAAG